MPNPAEVGLKLRGRAMSVQQKCRRRSFQSDHAGNGGAR
jgi:hypothetical protein